MSEIKFEDIRVGDRVRVTHHFGAGASAATTTHEGVVVELDYDDAPVGSVRMKDLGWVYSNGEPNAELLERPEPEFKPGQIWECGNFTFLTVQGDGKCSCHPVRFVAGARGVPRILPMEGLPVEVLNDLTYVGEAEIGVKR